MSHLTLEEEELRDRLADLVELLSYDLDPINLARSDEPKRRGRERLMIAVAAGSIATAVLVGLALWAQGGTSVATNSTASEASTTTPSTMALSTTSTSVISDPSSPTAVTEADGITIQRGGLLIVKRASNGAPNPAPGVAGVGTFDLWSAKGEPVMIDNVSTSSTTGLTFVPANPTWPTEINAVNHPTISYQLACTGGTCEPGDHQLTLIIQGHVAGGPVINAINITLDVLLPRTNPAGHDGAS